MKGDVGSPSDVPDSELEGVMNPAYDENIFWGIVATLGGDGPQEYYNDRGRTNSITVCVWCKRINTYLITIVRKRCSS